MSRGKARKGVWRHSAVAAICGVVSCLLSPAGAVGRADPPEETLWRCVQAMRFEGAVEPLSRLESLDRAAAAAARSASGSPSGLDLGRPIERFIEAAEGDAGHRAYGLVLALRGHPDAPEQACETWRAYRAGAARILDPEIRRGGAAAVPGRSGALTFVLVLVEPPSPEQSPRRLEAVVFEKVNRERIDRGRPVLERDPDLDAVARAHSRHMAQAGFFDHRGPDGKSLADRLRARGVAYQVAAENLFRVRGSDDPAADAVEGWMASRGHRRNLLDSRFRYTGVGAARSRDGTDYVTQVFALYPSAEAALGAPIQQETPAGSEPRP